jgi:type II secretory pathway component PulM
VNLRGWIEAARQWYAGHSSRDRRIMLGVVGAIVLSLIYVGVVEPLRAYRRSVAEEVVERQEELERASRFLAAADTLRAERDDLRHRLEAAKQGLLPGGSGTLGAAALQERANATAAEKGITVQSTQVMREEPADPFRKVSVRLTLSGELRPFSDFVAGLEYGQQHLTLPFVEVSRRGAVAGAKGPRTLSATVEVSGYLMGEPEKPGEPEAGGEAKEGEGKEGETKDGEAGEGEAAAVPEEGAPTGEAPHALDAPHAPPLEPTPPAAGNAQAPAPSAAVAPAAPLVPPAVVPPAVQGALPPGVVPVPGTGAPGAAPPVVAAPIPNVQGALPPGVVLPGAAAPPPPPPPPVPPAAVAPVPPPTRGDS